MSEPTYAVENGWLVELVNQHTCGTDRDGHYGAHEPGCGMVPIAKVDDLLAAAQRPEGVALAEAHGCEVEDEDTGRILICRTCADQRPEGVTVTEWGVRLAGGSVTSTGYMEGVSEGFARAAVRPDDRRVPPSPESAAVAVVSRQRTTFPDVVTEWAEVSGDTEAGGDHG